MCFDFFVVGGFLFFAISVILQYGQSTDLYHEKEIRGDEHKLSTHEDQERIWKEYGEYTAVVKEVELKGLQKVKLCQLNGSAGCVNGLL